MKICFVTHGLSEHYGYGRVSLNLVRSLNPLGITGPILTLLNSKPPKDLQSRTFPILQHQPTSPLVNPLLLLKDWSAINRYSHNCQGIHFLTESSLATNLFGYQKPYIVTTYGTWALKPLTSHLLSRWIFTRAYNQALAVTSISQFTKKQLQSHTPNAHHQVIHPGIDLPQWKSIQRRTQKPKNRKTTHILSVGTLHPSKGYLISVPAVAQLSTQIKKPLHYTIVSNRTNPHFQKQLTSIAKKYHFSKLSFIFKPSDQKLQNLYQQSNIFLLTSTNLDNDFEGFGVIFVEAFAMGIPVIASRSGAIPEVVQHHQTGLLAEEGNIQSTVRMLKKLINNPNLSQQLTQKALKKLPYFSSTRMAQEYSHLYHQIFT
jgi:glycosyltransferase involved in cell wall biosynthesis